VVFEDDSLIVIDKPAGLVVHPGSGNWSGTLLNALLFHAPQLDKVPRAGIVHRLDKDTSGLMVVAKTLEAQTDLVRQLQARTVKRHYQALARGIVDRSGTVDAPIGRHPTLRTSMAVVKTGKPARTHYRVLEQFVACTLIECALETGRTHQIRVHMTAIGTSAGGRPGLRRRCQPRAAGTAVSSPGAARVSPGTDSSADGSSDVLEIGLARGYVGADQDAAAGGPCRPWSRGG
jgi:23S rRNA pseudouridine1911/1915/1917 synthase